MLALVILQGLVLLVLAVLVVALLRTHAEVLRRLNDLGVPLDPDAPDALVTPVGLATARATGAAGGLRTAPGVPGPAGLAGALAHDIDGVTPAADPVAVAVTGVGHPTLLAFLSSGCRTCATYWAAFAEGLPAGPGTGLPDPTTRLVIVTGGPERESLAAVRALAPPRVTTVCSTEAWDHYGVPASPYFALVDGPSGRIVGEGSAATWDQVAGLLRRALADTDGTAEAALRAAGIGPGDPSLYPALDPAPSAGATQAPAPGEAATEPRVGA